MEALLDRIGTEIQIVTRSKVRYAGTLSAVNKTNETITLKKVRSYGTEGRCTLVHVKGTSQIYEYIIFKQVNIEALKLEGKWTDPAHIPVKKEKKKGKPQPPRDPAPKKNGLQTPNPKILPGEKSKNKTKEKPKPEPPQAPEEKRKSPKRNELPERKNGLPERRNEFLELPNPKMPSASYDFAKHNRQLKKLPVEKNEKHIYYDKDLSFFDSIT